MYERESRAERIQDALAGAVGNYTGALGQAAKSVRDKPRIEHSLDSIQKMLSVCFEGAQRIQNATTRIVGPTPEGPPGPAEVRPATQSIEARMSELLDATSRLAERLQTTASALDSAV